MAEALEVRHVPLLALPGLCKRLNRSNQQSCIDQELGATDEAASWLF